MNEVIYKYSALVFYRFQLKMYKGAEILTVQKRDEMIWMWAKVNTDAPLEERTFCWFETGATNQFNLKKEYKYIQTLQHGQETIFPGIKTYHLFEEIKKAVA